MKPGAKMTDRERLSRLLQYGDLSSTQRNIFQKWLDDLTRGSLAELSDKGRLWVEVLYEQQRVGERRAAARKKVRAAEQAKKEAATFSLMALPKKPPGH